MALQEKECVHALAEKPAVELVGVLVVIAQRGAAGKCFRRKEERKKLALL